MLRKNLKFQGLYLHTRLPFPTITIITTTNNNNIHTQTHRRTDRHTYDVLMLGLATSSCDGRAFPKIVCLASRRLWRRHCCPISTQEKRGKCRGAWVGGRRGSGEGRGGPRGGNSPFLWRHSARLGGRNSALRSNVLFSFSPLHPLSSLSPPGI